MATLMEKDVLMELATGAIALTKNDDSKQADEDRRQIKSFYYEILDNSPQEIDYQKSIENIQSIRKKYERI